MDKKIGLEHTIRNVVTESIGVSGTDKYKGTPRAFLRPVPLISPKKGDEHPDGSVNLAQRGRAKIDASNSSGTMRVEEKIGLEHTIRNVLENKLIGGLVTGVVKGGQLLYKYGDEAIETLKKAPVEKKPGLPYKEPPGKIELPPLEPAKPAGTPNVPAKPNTPPASVPDKPKTPSVETPPASVPDKPKTPPSSVPDKPKTDAPVKQEQPKNPPAKFPELNKTPDEVTTPKKDTEKQNIPRIDRKEQRKDQEKRKTEEKTQEKNKEKSRDKGKNQDKKDRWRWPLALGFGIPDSVSKTGMASPFDVNDFLHTAKKRRGGSDTRPRAVKEEIDLADAETIKKKTRKAQIIRKIIDEKKAEKKNTSTVILNPKLKIQEPDETR